MSIHVSLIGGLRHFRALGLIDLNFGNNCYANGYFSLVESGHLAESDYIEPLQHVLSTQAERVKKC